MVKRILKFFAYIAFFILALIYFTPKVSLYYYAEQLLKPFDVIVSSEVLEDNGLSLNINDGVVAVKSIESATVKELNIKLLGFYNSVDVKDIELSSVAKSFIPLKIKSVEIRHSIFNPIVVDVDSIGEFGEANVKINLLERTLHLVLHPSSLMLKRYKSTLRNLKKSENGEYIYDKTF